MNFEIISNRRELESRPNIEGLMGFWDLLATTILGPPSRFGSDPFRPLVISLIVIPIGWLAYWILGSRWKVFVTTTEEKPVRDKRPLGLFSLLYSIDTFIPFVTVTGVKDWGWETKGWSYWLIELPERLAGLYVFGAAAYSISYYVI